MLFPWLMSEQPHPQQRQSTSRGEHLRESADLLSVVTAVGGVAGGLGGLGSMYYGRKSYLTQQRLASDQQAPRDSDLVGNTDYDPGFGGSADYEPGFGGGIEYHPGFDVEADYDPGFGEDVEY